jgi:hypothetical protein
MKKLPVFAIAFLAIGAAWLASNRFRSAEADTPASISQPQTAPTRPKAKTSPATIIDSPPQTAASASLPEREAAPSTTRPTAAVDAPLYPQMTLSEMLLPNNGFSRPVVRSFSDLSRRLVRAARYALGARQSGEYGMIREASCTARSVETRA